MKNWDVSTVTIVFSKQPGGPTVSIADTVSWVEALLKGEECEGYNALRYSSGRVVSASVFDQA